MRGAKREPKGSKFSSALGHNFAKKNDQLSSRHRHSQEGANNKTIELSTGSLAVCQPLASHCRGAKLASKLAQKEPSKAPLNWRPFSPHFPSSFPPQHSATHTRSSTTRNSLLASTFFRLCGKIVIIIVPKKCKFRAKLVLSFATSRGAQVSTGERGSISRRSIKLGVQFCTHARRFRFVPFAAKQCETQHNWSSKANCDQSSFLVDKTRATCVPESFISTFGLLLAHFGLQFDCQCEPLCSPCCRRARRFCSTPDDNNNNE